MSGFEQLPERQNDRRCTGYTDPTKRLVSAGLAVSREQPALPLIRNARQGPNVYYRGGSHELDIAPSHPLRRDGNPGALERVLRGHYLSH